MADRQSVNAALRRLREVRDRLRAAVPAAPMVVSAVDLVDLARQTMPGAPAGPILHAAAAGTNAIEWDGAYAAGLPVPNGVYWARADGTDISAKVVLVR